MPSRKAWSHLEHEVAEHQQADLRVDPEHQLQRRRRRPRRPGQPHAGAAAPASWGSASPRGSGRPGSRRLSRISEERPSVSSSRQSRISPSAKPRDRADHGAAQQPQRDDDERNDVGVVPKSVSWEKNESCRSTPTITISAHSQPDPPRDDHRCRRDLRQRPGRSRGCAGRRTASARAGSPPARRSWPGDLADRDVRREQRGEARASTPQSRPSDPAGCARLGR